MFLKETIKNIQFNSIANQKTLVFMVAVHNENSKNNIFKISCDNGVPLSNLVYDITSDNYILQCAGYLKLGSVPISIEARMEGILDWIVPVPICEEILNNYLSPQQIKKVEKFKKEFQSNCKISFVQMLESFGDGLENSK